jgi:hypothetical protein
LFIPEAVNKTHDGAVLIRDLRIARAGIFLPMPEGTRIVDPTLGSRHRAAVGITEETDAVVVVVSEERGTITLCFPNGMVQNVDAASLRQALLGLLGSPAAPKRVPFWSRMVSAVRGDGASAKAKHDPSADEPSRDSEREEKPIDTPKTDMRSGGPPPSTAAPTKPASGAMPTVRKRVDSVVREAASGKADAAPDPGRTSTSDPDKVAEPSFLVVSEEPSPTPPVSQLKEISVPMRSSRDREEADVEPRLSLTTEVSKPMAPTELPATTALQGDEP